MRPWTIAGQVDSTPYDIGGAALKQMLQLNKVQQSRAHVVLQVRGEVPWNAWLGVAAAVAAPIVAAVWGPATAAVCVVPAAMALGARNICYRTWRGTRTMDLSSASKPQCLDSSRSPEVTVEQAADRIVESMRRYPSEHRASIFQATELAI